ncbi:hypothetical protein ACFX2I_041928 [Malus domestica]
MNINSVLSGGPHFQRSESIDRKSYLRLSALLMSFSSNNICMSGSSIMDGSSAVQLNSQHPQNSKKVKLKSMTQEPTAARGIECYIPTFQTGQASLPIGPIIDDVNSMQDMLDFCRRTNQAPDAKDAGNGSISKFSGIALPTDTNTLNKLRVLRHGLNNQKNNHHQMVFKIKSLEERKSEESFTDHNQ